MAKELIGVPILATGTYRGNRLVTFTVEDLAAMAKNSGVKRAVPVKLGHDDKQIIAQEDGQPALGWLSNFRVIGQQLLADILNMPDVLHRALAAGLWKQRSAEVSWSEQSGWEVLALALLGADLPAIAGLPDLENYLSTQTFSPDLPAAGTPVLLSWPTHEEKEMAEETDIKAKLAEAEAKTAKLEADMAAQKEVYRVAQFTAAKLAALQPIERLIADGRLEPKFREKVEAALEAQKVTFASGVVLSLPIDLSVELSTSAKLPKETPKAVREISGRADTILAHEAKRYMAEKGVDFDKATEAVLTLKPELFKAYNEIIPELHRGQEG